MTGEVILSDEWADIQFPYPGDVASNGTQLLGNFNQLYKLKQKHRNLKVILSVGGWSFRANFKPALSTAERRQKFCDSSLTLIADLGLDGLDIDWEYPEDATDAANYVETVKQCRLVSWPTSTPCNNDILTRDRPTMPTPLSTPTTTTWTSASLPQPDLNATKCCPSQKWTSMSTTGTSWLSTTKAPASPTSRAI